MAKSNNNAKCPVKTSLDLKPTGDGKWIDQHGRILELYTNAEGKQDLRPVGVGYRQ